MFIANKNNNLLSLKFNLFFHLLLMHIFQLQKQIKELIIQEKNLLNKLKNCGIKKEMIQLYMLLETNGREAIYPII